MKKRRVLALLLALSLAMSTNGMTVFAAEAGDLATPAVSFVEEGTEDETEQTDAAEDDARDEQDIDSEETDKNGETGDDLTEDQTGKDDDGTNAGEDSETSGEKDSDEQDPNAEDAGEETVSENDVPDVEEPEAKEAEELPETIKNEIRMVTFTDDTGLKITYDANAAVNYRYTVNGGVLTKVEEANGTDADGTPIWKDATFTGNVELTQPKEGDKYTSVAAGLFSGNRNITYVKLPDGVTSIAGETFIGCTALKGAYLPATVTSIGDSAFEGCTAMTQIAVPKTVTTIGNKAFIGDASLYMVYMKDVDYSELTSIGDSAFEGCSALAEFCSDMEFYIPTSMKEIGEKAFCQCKSIAKLDLNTAELNTMGASAFEDCTGLKSAVMCRTLATIPARAFYGCKGLELLQFNGRASETIGERAFYGCHSLTQIELPVTVKTVSQFAFAGCTKLSSVIFKNPGTQMETNAFPAGQTLSCLVFVGDKYYDKNKKEKTEIYAYYLGLDPVKIAFVDPSDTEENKKQYYFYKVADSDGNIKENGNLTGGQIWVCPAGKNSIEDNINTLNDKKGVPSDGTKYYVYTKAREGYELVKGSLKTNGETVQKDDKGRYYITMPYGGTVITAEFREKNAANQIEGGEQDVTIEFSNGETIQKDWVKIKIGQQTRMFLFDKSSGKTITASQIQEIKSENVKVAKVSADGVITAVGKGDTGILVKLIGGNAIPFTVRGMVSVVEDKIASISLKASDYNSSEIRVDGDAHGIQTAVVGKNHAKDGLTFTLKANAYTAEREGIAKELTWKSSDTSVATLKKASTTSADSSNVVTIKPGTEGEATITVTAKIDSKNTVTQKFVVSVQNQNLKLASSSVTINPNLKEQGELEIISVYGASLPSDVNPPKLIEKVGNDWVPNSKFLLQAKPQTESDISSGRRRYGIEFAGTTMKDGKYKVYVCFDEMAKDSSLPLTITVKRSVPAPTVKFNTKKTKFSLFYRNGGTDKEGDPITVTTEVTKLGKAKVEKFELCALSDKPEDQLFTDNFEIVDDQEDLAKGIVRIRKKNDYLQYTTGKSPKAVVAGYLMIYYEGYRDEAAKKVKVTMPTVTTAPAYVLERTSETYRTGAPTQHETIKFLDKKTKQQITFTENVELLRVESEASIVDTKNAKLENSEVSFDVYNPQKDKVTIILKNPTEWDRDKNGADRTLSYAFNVKVTSNEPTVTTDQTVTLNLNYPEVEGRFRLKSNQRDTVLDESQEFKPNKTTKNALEYDKLEVSYENGEGTVKISSGAEKPKAGTYKWTCNAAEKDGYAPLSKVTTLTVKVVDTKPAVKLGKGSLVLNLAAVTRTDEGTRIYGEKADIPLKITGKPEGYELDTDVNAGEDSTQIVCMNESGAEDRFVWELEDVRMEDDKPVDGKLSVSIKDMPLTKKTYKFEMTARYVQQVQEGDTPNVVDAKPMTFNVKVDNNADISVSFAAKGKLNLVDREGEPTTKNTLIYTPSLKNIRGKIEQAWIYDADTDEVSRYFDIKPNPEDGKLYVTPKKISSTDTESGTKQDYQYAELENNKQYRVKIEVKVDGFDRPNLFNNGIMSKPITIKTAQVLPKVKTDKSTLDVYLSNKEYDATFTVTPQDGAAGIVEKIEFQEKDEVPRDAFDVSYVEQQDGSLKVIVHLKQAVAYKCGSTNKVKMYIKFKGQGTNTAGTLVNMNIRVNK